MNLGQLICSWCGAAGCGCWVKCACGWSHVAGGLCNNKACAIADPSPDEIRAAPRLADLDLLVLSATLQCPTHAPNLRQIRGRIEKPWKSEVREETLAKAVASGLLLQSRSYYQVSRKGFAAVLAIAQSVH